MERNVWKKEFISSEKKEKNKHIHKLFLGTRKRTFKLTPKYRIDWVELKFTESKAYE